MLGFVDKFVMYVLLLVRYVFFWVIIFLHRRLEGWVGLNNRLKRAPRGSCCWIINPYSTTINPLSLFPFHHQSIPNHHQSIPNHHQSFPPSVNTQPSSILTQPSSILSTISPYPTTISPYPTVINPYPTTINHFDNVTSLFRRKQKCEVYVEGNENVTSMCGRKRKCEVYVSEETLMWRLCLGRKGTDYLLEVLYVLLLFAIMYIIWRILTIISTLYKVFWPLNV